MGAAAASSASSPESAIKEDKVVHDAAQRLQKDRRFFRRSSTKQEILTGIFHADILKQVGGQFFFFFFPLRDSNLSLWAKCQGRPRALPLA